MRFKLSFIVCFKYRRIHESEHSWSALPRRDIESKSRIVDKDVSTAYWKRYPLYLRSFFLFKLEYLKALKWCIVMDRWQLQMFPIRPFLSRYKCQINFMLFISEPTLKHFRVQTWVNCMAQVKHLWWKLLQDLKLSYSIIRFVRYEPLWRGPMIHGLWINCSPIKACGQKY